ncbi:MAG: M23 family metallopeptidase [Pseudomonadota bacterium]
MRITVSISGKDASYNTHFSLRRFISVSVLVSLVLLVSSRSTESVYENQIRVSAVKENLLEQKAQIERLQSDTEQKIGVVVNDMAVMKAEISRLDIISERLAKTAGLEIDDFMLSDDLRQSLHAHHDLQSGTEILEKSLELKIQQLEALESVLFGLNIDHQSKLAGRPIEKGWLSSNYGLRKDPFNGKPTMHRGVDYAGKEGSPVIATGAGIVTWSAPRYGYGYMVEIDHGNGLRTRYAHNKENTVNVGDVVTRGQLIALMGSTGRSTGVHVHYEVLRNGQRVDPTGFINR